MKENWLIKTYKSGAKGYALFFVPENNFLELYGLRHIRADFEKQDYIDFLFFKSREEMNAARTMYAELVDDEWKIPSPETVKHEGLSLTNISDMESLFEGTTNYIDIDDFITKNILTNPKKCDINRT